MQKKQNYLFSMNDQEPGVSMAFGRANVDFTQK